MITENDHMPEDDYLTEDDWKDDWVPPGEVTEDDYMIDFDPRPGLDDAGLCDAV